MLGRDISLTYKLLLFVLIAAILPVVLMSISSFTTYNAIQDDVTTSIDTVKQIAINDLEKNMQNTRDDKIDKYSKILESIEKQAETAALYTEKNWEHLNGAEQAAAFDGMVWAGPYNAPEKRAEHSGQLNKLSHLGVLLQQMDSAEEYTSLVYFGTPDNNVVTSKNITETIAGIEGGFSSVERPWYQQASTKRETVWTNTYVDAHTHELTTTVAVPATDDGNLVGVVGADVTLGVLSNDILETDPGFAFLLDAKGETIVYPGMRAPEKTAFAERTFNSTNFLEDDVSPELQKLAEDMVAGKRGIRQVTIEGERTYVAYGPLEANDWSVGIAVPVSETTEQVRALEHDVNIDENIRNAMYEYSALLVLMLLIVTGTGVYFSHHITQPIIRLHEKAESISKGGIGDEVDIQTGDEIEDLANSFNRVIRTIKILQRRDAPTYQTQATGTDSDENPDEDGSGTGDGGSDGGPSTDGGDTMTVDTGKQTTARTASEEEGTAEQERSASHTDEEAAPATDTDTATDDRAEQTESREELNLTSDSTDEDPEDALWVEQEDSGGLDELVEDDGDADERDR